MAESIHEKDPYTLKPCDPTISTVSEGQGTIITTTVNEHAVNRAIEAIGMGKYQWQLLFSCGFGFLMLLVKIGIVMPNASKEFDSEYPTMLTASLYAGLFVGAVTCGFLADLMGRRVVWQFSIFGVSIATMLAASSPNWAAVHVWTALSGLFAGGNLAIDLAVLAESLPRSWAFLLTGLACVWGLGNAITGLIAWPLVANFCCPNGSTPETCTRAENMGWRYLDITLGGLCLLMSIVRTFALGMHESPRWLVGQGKLEEAIVSLNLISSKNNSDYVASLDHFSTQENTVQQTTWLEGIKSIRELFSSRRKLQLMSCLILLWAFVGIAYPLYNVFLSYYLEAHGAKLGDGSNYQTYRDWAISSVAGIPGPLLSAYLVYNPAFGHRWALVITSCVCAIFAGLFTRVRTEAQNIAFSCMINFWLNAVYAVVYAYTPESLETKHRGVGCGLLLACGRFASLASPFIATFGDVTSGVPLFVSCALYVLMGVLGYALPVLPR